MKTTGKANEDIVKILLDQDELTWQNIILELVNSQDMNPWDIDISLLAAKFFEIINTLKEMDFRITGKLVLAAALLLKIKSNQLLEEDLTALDSLIAGEEEVDLLEEMEVDYKERTKYEQPTLIPRTPKPRKRKVSVDDLITALEKALKVEVRRTRFVDEAVMEVNVDNIDLSVLIQDVYKQVNDHHKEGNQEILTFTKLLPEGASKDDMLFTFIPLLHLDHARNIDLSQEESFGEIRIAFLKELDPNFVIPEGDLGS